MSEQKIINEEGIAFGLLPELIQLNLEMCNIIFMWTQGGYWSLDRSHTRFHIERAYKGYVNPDCVRKFVGGAGLSKVKLRFVLDRHCAHKWNKTDLPLNEVIYECDKCQGLINESDYLKLKDKPECFNTKATISREHVAKCCRCIYYIECIKLDHKLQYDEGSGTPVDVYEPTHAEVLFVKDNGDIVSEDVSLDLDVKSEKRYWYKGWEFKNSKPALEAHVILPDDNWIEYTPEVQSAVEFAREWEGKKMTRYGIHSYIEFESINWHTLSYFLSKDGINYDKQGWREYKQPEMIPLDAIDIKTGDALKFIGAMGWSMIGSMNIDGITINKTCYTWQEMKEQLEICSIHGEWRKCEKPKP